MAVIKKYFELKKLDGAAFGLEYQRPQVTAQPAPKLTPLEAPQETSGTGLAQEAPAKPELAGSPPPPP